MQAVDHPYVLKAYEYGSGNFVSQQGQGQEQWLYIALELAQKEILYDYVCVSGSFRE